MFETMIDRIEAAAARRVARHVEALAVEARTMLPEDVAVEAGREGMVLTGRGLRRRLVLDGALRWLTAGGWR